MFFVLFSFLFICIYSNYSWCLSSFSGQFSKKPFYKCGKCLVILAVISSSVVFIPVVSRKLKSARVIVKHSHFKLIQFIVTPPCCLGLVLFLELINTNSNLTLLISPRANINLYRSVPMCGPKRKRDLCIMFYLWNQVGK